MKKITIYLFLLTSTLFLNSCASILNSKNQKVTVQTGSANSKVYVNNVLAGTGSSVVTKMPRNASVQQIKVEREGYKPTYKIHYQTGKSPLYIMSWVPFGLLVYPPFMDIGPKSYDYKKEISVSASSLEIKKRADDEKYIYLKNTAFDVKKEDVKLKKTKHRSYKKAKNKFKESKVFDEDIKFNNSIFSEAVDEILKNNNYIDTTQTIFKSKTNTLYISSKITKVEFQDVYSIYARQYMNFLVTKIDIEWEIYDLYDQSKYKKSFKAESGEFAMKTENFVRMSVEDAITESFYKFLDAKEVRDIIKKENEEKINYEQLVLTKSLPINNLEDALNSTVTIKVKNGHGSGCVVSKDGYVVTNFHVVSSTDKITVVDRNGKEYNAKVIRKNENLDLALIKLDDADFKNCYQIPSEKNYIIGDDIFVIGTPTSVELGQSLTKGIVSGTRTFDKNNFIQTDASVNGGNSGGALTKKSGELIGIVNAKVSGFGVEGIGFSIPAELIVSGLFVKN
ncbi:S1C family serine protease [Flavobacterium lacus]|uniref:Trypsin-like peptidase n=1 Tax=Flavobacterium lacus TaxID=1353778 RepID=A0A328WNC1_9FLAO|nr:trypsin-like peptidase domain-containing protein [Flavobacterium lacus]RAR47822.1 trypsin-like peptidase [Flavobacterium lacus]